MTTRTRPTTAEMYDALARRDDSYEGIFVIGVRTTGILCRPGCPARTPAPANIEYFDTAADALQAGYRPCKRCRPMEPAGATPDWLRGLLEALEADPGLRLNDAGVRALGLDPARVRRWFKAHHAMTFHAYQRARRLGRALGNLSLGAPIMQTAFDAGFESLSGFTDAVQKLAGDSPGRARGAKVVSLTRINTPLGPMIVGATDEELHLLEFTDRRMLETQFMRLRQRLGAVLAPGETDVSRETAREITAYFAGELREFSVPLSMSGTDFQQAAWTAMRAIPYGQTWAYSRQAQHMGRAKAVRAVGRANGANPIAIIVPCHRVIGADGSLTGYGGGLWRKRYLLDLEQGRRELLPRPPA